MRAARHLSSRLAMHLQISVSKTMLLHKTLRMMT
jgi:hypothetical protein